MVNFFVDESKQFLWRSSQLKRISHIFLRNVEEEGKQSFVEKRTKIFLQKINGKLKEYKRFLCENLKLG